VPLFAFTLKQAANARERAAAAVDETTRNFHQAMESKWMDLAASTAFVGRVDLFMQSREFRPRLSPSDLCSDCNKQMLLKPSTQFLLLKSASSDAEIVAPSILDSFAPKTFRIDGACGRSLRPWSSTQTAGVRKRYFLTQN